MNRSSDIKHPDAVVVFPPPMDRIDRVYAAPHFLCSFLNSRGLYTYPLDLNLAAFYRLAKSPLLDREAKSIGQELARLENRARLSKEEDDEYQRLFKQAAQLNHAKKTFLSVESGYDLMALEIHGQRYTRFFLDLYKKVFGLFYKTHLLSPEGILRMAVSPAAHTIVNLLEGDIRRDIVETETSVVGFSIPFSHQLAPAVALAQRIKRSMEKVHICFGGPVITLLSGDTLKTMHEILPVDSFAKYEGEHTLLELVEAVRSGESLGHINGLLAFEKKPGRKTGGRKAGKPPAFPGHDHNRFEYANIRNIPRSARIPIRHSAGCYWKKCTFCDYINLHRDKTYRPRAVDDIIEDFRYYTAMGFYRFQMLTEAIPPAHAVKLAAAIIENRLNIFWHSFIRVDRGFSPEIFKTLQESGFNFTVGMESANDRVLAVLNKGYDTGTLRAFVDNMRKASFKGNHLNVMVGVPGEQYEEALETLEFCQECTDVFGWFKAYEFTLSATSDMGRRPEKYGITIREGRQTTRADRYNGRLGKLDFEDPEGMSEEEKSAVFAFYQRLNEKTGRESKSGIQNGDRRSASETNACRSVTTK